MEFFWLVKSKLTNVAWRISSREATEALKMQKPMENLTLQRRKGALRESGEVG
jgi:hypothetical protein